MEHCIHLVDITKTFGRATVLDRINLYIDENEFVTLLGPSGCGKTTTLRIIGGFESPTQGDILFRGSSWKSVPPHRRKVNTVFQRYALFPNMNVADNVAFGLRVNRQSGISQKVAEMLKLVNLDGYQNRSVTSLSGGQQQRVAIARALVNKPQVLLLDEPLGALDLKLRKEMQIELKKMQQQVGITFVYVTHDQDEALTMSDTIAVMNEGRILQIGKPEDIYNEPKNKFVAQFIGESNLVPGTMPEDGHVIFAGTPFRCVDSGFTPGEAVDVVIRPEDIALVAPETGALTGVVCHTQFKGVHYEMQVEAAGVNWKVHSTVLSPVGKTVGMHIAPELIHVMRKQHGGTPC